MTSEARKTDKQDEFRQKMQQARQIAEAPSRQPAPVTPFPAQVAAPAAASDTMTANDPTPATLSSLAVEPRSAARSTKARASFPIHTLSADIALEDKNKLEDVVLARKRAGERRFSHQQAVREMLGMWLRKHGVEPFNYEVDQPTHLSN